MSSLRRRILAMAEAQDLPIEFHALSSRDIIQTVHDVTKRLDCRWLVMEWHGRSRRRLHDRHSARAGSPITSRATSPPSTITELATFARFWCTSSRGPHDALVLGTSDTLAQANDADLTFVRFVDTDAAPAERQSAADYLDQVRDVSAASSGGLVAFQRQDLSGARDRERQLRSGVITAGEAARESDPANSRNQCR